MGEATGEAGGGLPRKGFFAAMGAAALAALHLARSSSGGYQQQASAEKANAFATAVAKETLGRQRGYKRENFKVVTLGNVQPREQKGTMEDPITAPNPYTAAEKVYTRDVWSKHPFQSSLEPIIKKISGVDSFMAGDQIVLPDPDVTGEFFAVKKGERLPKFEKLGVFVGFDARGVRFRADNSSGDDVFSFDDPLLTEDGKNRVHFVAGLNGQTLRLACVQESVVQEASKNTR